MVQYPEDYHELTTYLDSLFAHTWKAILNAKHMGGDERVVAYLRRECPNTLRLWSDQELLEYLLEKDLKEDFLSVDERF